MGNLRSSGYCMEHMHELRDTIFDRKPLRYCPCQQMQLSMFPPTQACRTNETKPREKCVKCRLALRLTVFLFSSMETLLDYGPDPTALPIPDSSSSKHGNRRRPFFWHTAYRSLRVHSSSLTSLMNEQEGGTTNRRLRGTGGVQSVSSGRQAVFEQQQYDFFQS